MGRKSSFLKILKYGNILKFYNAESRKERQHILFDMSGKEKKEKASLRMFLHELGNLSKTSFIHKKKCVLGWSSKHLSLKLAFYFDIYP